MLSNEELLKPRYKVIADYPFNSHTIGEIIIDPADDDYSQANPNKSWPLLSLPHLFKPLQWWEERGFADLPEYVKHNPDSSLQSINGSAAVFKATWLESPECRYWVNIGDENTIHADHIIPATESEYTAYQSTQTKNKNTDHVRGFADE